MRRGARNPALDQPSVEPFVMPCDTKGTRQRESFKMRQRVMTNQDEEDKGNGHGKRTDNVKLPPSGRVLARGVLLQQRRRRLGRLGQENKRNDRQRDGDEPDEPEEPPPVGQQRRAGDEETDHVGDRACQGEDVERRSLACRLGEQSNDEVDGRGDRGRSSHSSESSEDEEADLVVDEAGDEREHPEDGEAAGEDSDRREEIRHSTELM